MTFIALYASVASAGTARVTLPEAATTSAGVFDSSGALVHTLWSGKRRDAGTLVLEWNGERDDGRPPGASDKYVARVIAHDVRYVWEGVIGNTSLAASGTSVHRGFNPINDVAIDHAGNAFYVNGYNEQQNAIHRFRTSDPQRRVPLAHDDYRRVFRYAATDGTLAYFANVGLMAPVGNYLREPATFVIALRVSDGSEYRFAAGKVEMPDVPGNRWQSAIDSSHDAAEAKTQFRSAPSGLAVQQRGNRLFVAHGELNEIRVLDKRSGELLEHIPVTSPGDMDVASDDSLWVICRVGERPALARYQLHGAQWTRETLLTDDLIDPVALGVSPVDGTVVVADAGTEQLKAFAPDDHRPLWTIGRKGGYADGDPQVAMDRLWLSAGPTYVTFQPDGSFWVGDPGNVRNLHFSAQRRYLEQIMYLPASYIVAVDPADPQRVFRHFMEFHVDYSRPLRESWTLVRNWAAGLDPRYQAGFAGFRSVYTLNNHRTYGTLHRADLRKNEIVELTAEGVRPTGALLDIGTKLYADGSLRSQQTGGNGLQINARRLRGFDAEGNPRWDESAALAQVTALKKTDPYYHDVPLIVGVNEATFPVTGSGIVVSFNPGPSGGFHLGGIRAGASSWSWRASPAATWDLDAQGNILTLDGSFEVGHRVQYPGSVVSAVGRQIVAGLHGESWNNGQADQWLHFLDDGLFVGQFGRPVYPANNRVDARPESAGNAFSPQLVAVNGELYLWHNDESVHAGVHRWKITGTERIKTLEAPIEP